MMNSKKAFQVFLSVIIFMFSTKPAHADEGLLGEIKQPQQSQEYIFRSSPKESLISVQLLGAVTKPGIYYVPANTDLLKLLTLAGGNNNSGDLTEVLVRKLEPKTWDQIQSKAVSEYKGAYEVDTEKIIKYGGASKLKLAQDDFVYVPAKTPWVSTETARGITILSLVMGIVLTSILIQKNTDHR
jgi:hypothetical protein